MENRYGFLDRNGNLINLFANEHSYEIFHKPNGYKPVVDLTDSMPTNVTEFDLVVTKNRLNIKKNVIESYLDVVKNEKTVLEKLLFSLNKEISSTDYIFSKVNEYNLINKEHGYNLTEIHEKREAIRLKIREVENKLLTAVKYELLPFIGEEQNYKTPVVKTPSVR